MPEFKEDHHQFRFFSESSLLKQKQKEISNIDPDPIPFGLNYQEPVPDANNLPNGPSFSQSTTNVPPFGSDTSVDIDFPF